MLDNDQPRPTVEVLRASHGLAVGVVDVGATIQSISVPTAQGRTDVILSYAELGRYLTDTYYVGSTVGPVANRIRNAKFKLDDTLYHLDANDADRGNCLHGGTRGLNRQRFSLQREKNRPLIRCFIDLPHSFDGFPGNRSFEVAYELVDKWSLAIDFTATTDRDTVINLANHAYFNLGGNLDDHRIRVLSESLTAVDNLVVPTGELRKVHGTEYDLREMQPLGDRQFDHNYVLGDARTEPRLSAQLQSTTTGLQLNVLTTQPGIQVYTGDYLSDPFHPRQGICFEAQGFPDAPNQPNFPSVRLEAGATYCQRTIYQFSRTGYRN